MESKYHTLNVYKEVKRDVMLFAVSNDLTVNEVVEMAMKKLKQERSLYEQEQRTQRGECAA